jgi:hypothetical protein
MSMGKLNGKTLLLLRRNPLGAVYLGVGVVVGVIV